MFYKIARNVGNHHEGLKWMPEENLIILSDENNELSIEMYEFQQNYRYLVYLCDYGTRGILAAFCEHERGSISKWLLKEYMKTFPENFPPGEEATVIFD